ESLIFEKTSVAERLNQVFGEFAHLEVARQAHERRAQVQLCLNSVEALETLDQQGRNDQHGVGKAVGIADEEAWVVRGRRGHEIEREAQARQWRRALILRGRHVLS